MMEHLSLGKPRELDLTRFKCSICENELYRAKGPDTNWQWYYFVVGTRMRHFKSRCNLATPEQWEKYNYHHPKT